MIDGELTEQLDELIEAVEAIRWVDVPGIDSQTASAFHRKLVEARSDLLTPRVVTDGGITDEQLETMSQLASNEVHEATRKLTNPEELDPDGAAVLLDQAAEQLAEISDADPESTAREQIMDEPPNRKIDVSGETSGYFCTDLEIAVDSVRVSEIYTPGPNSTSVASLTVRSELGTLGFWMSLEEWLDFREAVDEVSEYVKAAVAEELEQARRKAGKT